MTKKRFEEKNGPEINCIEGSEGTSPSKIRGQVF